jgi:hypothetical protein
VRPVLPPVLPVPPEPNPPRVEPLDPPLVRMAQCGDDRGNPDLAVAFIEVSVFALGVLIWLRCLGHVHCFSPAVLRLSSGVYLVEGKSKK